MTQFFFKMQPIVELETPAPAKTEEEIHFLPRFDQHLSVSLNDQAVVWIEEEEKEEEKKEKEEEEIWVPMQRDGPQEQNSPSVGDIDYDHQDNIEYSAICLRPSIAAVA